MGRETTISILSNDVFPTANDRNTVITVVAVVTENTVRRVSRFGMRSYPSMVIFCPERLRPTWD